MQILAQACGAYSTNCYILKHEKGDFIIDPGQNAFEFIKKNVTRVCAVLNTHGHFDHVWDNAAVKEEFKVPIYIHKDDEFMLEDPFEMGHRHSKADFLISTEEELEICGVKFRFLHFAGHTPGCCMIELVGENLAFSGDFLFKGSIGRYDFPYSDPNSMKQSLERVAKFTQDLRLLPGHGGETTLKEEQKNLGWWLNAF
ncbi:MBL fold metallo-hydrolase [Campylobacter troglodytis]|uniref:MBL fold metallo-hydrolase n=1 Tax=Campylobacter troglodytis TaxID=654363 RepID=UPI0011588F82|nr:MBL fold metallo-hydrolase [Campylobacter troglodytis]TQR61062.1 MBL fold metallo-hydrolase [Campylobacter troglodytis]